MADLYAVTFRGDDMLSASEGEFTFQPGLLRRRMSITDTPTGSVVKDHCSGTATHVLKLIFATTTTNVNTIWSKVYGRLQEMWDGVPGTLGVPDFKPFPNCVITDISLSEQTRIVQPFPLNTGTDSFVTGVTVEATVTFEQLSA